MPEPAPEPRTLDEGRPEPKGAGPERPDGHRNEVFVVGRVTAAPAERELPSGDRLVTWRIGVARAEVSGRRRARADSLTLVSFDPHMCDRVHGWRIGDVVRVTGELRRRFWRGWNGVRSVLEVEVGTVALVRRAER
ncbi:single-stranded DNA-binding protein [Nocardiopsis ganjiahuensis]|uniref:single-stranded DNA-binding protein n=1 Tax=Nocardiopsis ganjiahuensis TaxID=239984 RepID=UPI0003474BDA|nr:single-stranded DNA-binding protein [Nocardiopsis ganjiahuensis]